MTGTARTISQPATTGSILAAVGMAAAILAAAVAIAWGSANLGKTTQAAAVPAAIYAPAVRDLGARDQSAPKGLGLDTVLDHGSSVGSGLSKSPVQVGGFGGTRLPDAPTNGSTHAGLRAQ